MLKGGEPTVLEPYFNNFKGTVESLGDGEYRTVGLFNRKSSKCVEITEIPVGAWVSPYKDFLESKLDTILKNVESLTRDENTGIKFNLEFNSKEVLDDLLDKDKFVKEFKLTKNLNVNNMYLFDTHDTPRKYTVQGIIKEYYTLRLDLYGKRREFLIAKLEREAQILDNKVRFTKEYIEGVVKINNVGKAELTIQLVKRRYILVDEKYDYLTNLPLISLTKERMQTLEKLASDKRVELTALKGITPEEMWTRELKTIQ